MTAQHRLAEIVQRFAGRRVLVLGDMVADEYIVGRPARISREAPVLILHYANSFVRPGGATNTAYNLSRLGAKTSVAGIIGDDDRGRSLAETLGAAGIATGGLFIDPSRPTSTKTRIVAKGTQQEVQQQVVRIDQIDDSALEGDLRDTLVDYVCSSLNGMEALVISDYENGVISPEVLEACLPTARRQNVTVIVDSHGDLLRFKGVTAATPNQPEAAGTLHRTIESDEELEAGGWELVAGMEAQGVLITRGSQGIALFERGGAVFKLPIAVSNESEVVDPTGAGDTVAAVFTLALVSGGSMREAAYLGNLAGGEVVRKLGAATLTGKELTEALHNTNLPFPSE